jgi:hypothetical protein
MPGNWANIAKVASPAWVADGPVSGPPSLARMNSSPWSVRTQPNASARQQDTTCRLYRGLKGDIVVGKRQWGSSNVHDIGVGISTGIIGATIVLSLAWVEVTRMRTIAALAMAKATMEAMPTKGEPLLVGDTCVLPTGRDQREDAGSHP